jgi:hypothetical protein
MNTTHEALHEVRKIMVREDLELPFPATLLIRMVYDATDHALWAPSAGRSDEPPDSVLRSVLVYCYATGVFSSSDIEAAAAHDPVVRYLCANHRPQWQTIRDFRRRNVPGLKLALARLFALSLCEAQSFEHRCEAEQRLARAIQADSCAMDV